MATPSPKLYRTSHKANISRFSPAHRVNFDSNSEEDLKAHRENDSIFTSTMANSHCFSDFYEECNDSKIIFKVSVHLNP